MFKIHNRIAQDEDFIGFKNMTLEYFNKEWNNIHGYLEIIIEDYKIGYYHEDLLLDDKICGDWVNGWLELLANAVYYLPKTKYVAFQEPEVWRWLEFTFIGENEIIFKHPMDKGWLETTCYEGESLPEIEEPNDEEAIEATYIGSKEIFITEKNVELFIVEPLTEYRFNYENMKSEVIGAIDKFFCELVEINPTLMETQMAKDLLEKIDRIHQ